MPQLLDIERVNRELRTSHMGRRLVYLRETTSTMVVAAEEAQRGAAEGLAVVAEEQSAGRGRLQRSWTAPAGSSVLVSVVLRPGLDRMQKISIAVAVALVRAIEQTTGLRPTVKWPNDVLVDGRKVAGILIESHLHGGEVEFAVVGVGINVNFDLSTYPEIAETATSLSSAIGKDVSREEVLIAFLQQLEDCYEEIAHGDGVFREWVSKLATIGKQVTASFGSVVEEGVAEGVDADGALILRRSDGTLVRVAAGDVTLRRPTA